MRSGWVLRCAAPPAPAPAPPRGLLTLPPRFAQTFKRLIDGHYRVNLILDNLPVTVYDLLDEVRPLEGGGGWDGVGGWQSAVGPGDEAGPLRWVH
jgi:hypothetical protein